MSDPSSGCADQRQYEMLRDTLRAEADYYMRFPGLVGVGIATRVDNSGAERRSFVLQFRSSEDHARFVQSRTRLPDRIENLPVVFEVVRERMAAGREFFVEADPLPSLWQRLKDRFRHAGA